MTRIRNSGKISGSTCIRCKASPTCEAHIIPQAFAREIRRTNNHILQLNDSGTKKAKRPLGIADHNILCSTCDGTIGNADKYAIEFVRNFKIPPGSTPYSTIPLDGLQTDIMRIFALSVVWKASVSSLDWFDGIDLGPYERTARGLIFDGHGLDLCTKLHVQINVLTSSAGDVSSFMTYPIRVRNENGPYFIFLAGGFQFLVRFGNRPFITGIQQPIANSLAIRSDQKPFAVLYPFEDAGEFEIVKMAQNADLARAASKQ
jgi:hypothetical protein